MPDQSDATLPPKAPPRGPSPWSDATLSPKASPQGVAAKPDATLPSKAAPRGPSPLAVQSDATLPSNAAPPSPPGAQLLARLEAGGGQALLFLGSGAEEGSAFGGEKTSDAGILVD